MASNLIARTTARTRADAHMRDMKINPDGYNHGILKLRTPKGKSIGIVCLCGLQFWTHAKCILPKPEDYGTRKAFIRAFRVAVGVRTTDPGKRKARKMAGAPTRNTSRKSSSKRDWFI